MVSNCLLCGFRSINIFVCGGDDKGKPKISQYVNKLVVLSVTESGDITKINGRFSMNCLDIELQHMSTTGSKIVRENYMKLDCGGEDSAPINAQHVPNKSVDGLRILKTASSRSGVVSPFGIMNEINMNCDSEYCVKLSNCFVNGNLKANRVVVGCVSGPRCHECNAFGHIAVNCHKKKPSTKDSVPEVRSEGNVGSRMNASFASGPRIGTGFCARALPASHTNSGCEDISVNKRSWLVNKSQHKKASECQDFVYVDDILSVDTEEINSNLGGDVDSQEVNSNSGGDDSTDFYLNSRVGQSNLNVNSDSDRSKVLNLNFGTDQLESLSLASESYADCLNSSLHGSDDSLNSDVGFKGF